MNLQAPGLRLDLAAVERPTRGPAPAGDDAPAFSLPEPTAEDAPRTESRSGREPANAPREPARDSRPRGRDATPREPRGDVAGRDVAQPRPGRDPGQRRAPEADALADAGPLPVDAMTASVGLSPVGTTDTPAPALAAGGPAAVLPPWGEAPGTTAPTAAAPGVSGTPALATVLAQRVAGSVPATGATGGSAPPTPGPAPAMAGPNPAPPATALPATTVPPAPVLPAGPAGTEAGTLTPPAANGPAAASAAAMDGRPGHAPPPDPFAALAALAPVRPGEARAAGEDSAALELVRGAPGAGEAPPPPAGSPDARVLLAPAARTETTAPALPVVPGSVALPASPEAGFDDGLGQKILWMTDQKISQAEMRVSPEGAGPIEVRLQVDGHRVSAQFAAANPEVRQALEAGMGRLRDLLGQHGMELADSQVGQQSAGDPRGQRARELPRGAEEAMTPGTVTTLGDLRRRGLVDVYA